MDSVRMEGLGNCYVFIDVTATAVDNPAELSRRVSDRSTGPGSDGLVLIGLSDRADFSMRIFNADGSEAEMCGNAARCVGKYVYERGLTTKTLLTLDTLSGIRTLRLFVNPEGKVDSVQVEMGAALIREELETVCGKKGLRVCVGNPHFVMFGEESILAEAETVGPRIECDPSFPHRTNVEFAYIESADLIKMRVWERGSGITKACGTGACATAAAALRLGLVNGPVTVRMDGGDLNIEFNSDGGILMTGPANFI